MNPQTMQYIAFAEGLAALAAKAITDIKSVLTGSAEKSIEELLSDADATYIKLISDATAAPQPIVDATKSA